MDIARRVPEQNCKDERRRLLYEHVVRADDLIREIKQLRSPLQAFKSLQRSQIRPQEILEKDVSQRRGLKKRAKSHDITHKGEATLSKS